MSDRWPPLTTPTPVDGIPEQKHRHDAADIFGIFKNITVAGDIWSSNWDGGHDLTAGRDTVATLGYFMDSSAGAAQFKTIYADGGELRTLTVTGTLSLNATGKLETTSGYSVGGAIKSVVIDGGFVDRIKFYSGGANETVVGYIYGDNNAGDPYLVLRGPSTAAATVGTIGMWKSATDIDHTSRTRLLVGGVSKVSVDTTDASFGVNLVPSTPSSKDIGTATAAWEDSYIETMYCDRGDGTYVEAAPRGTLLAYGFTGSGTNRAIQGGGADAEIIVTEGGSAVTVACEYVGQLVVVDVTIMGTVSGITAGEWWRLVPWINGAAASGWIAQYNEALSAVGYSHSAGAAPGLGHSAGGTGNTSAASSGTSGAGSAHSHSMPGRSVTGTSGAASAGTAHTHSSGTYQTSTISSANENAHTHSISHTHTGPSHSDHGTHTIADHATHTHATTYDGTWTGRWVGQATADASKEVILSIGGCTETTDAALNQHSLAYIVWRL